MDKFLKKLITRKESDAKNLRTKIEQSENLKEVRALGEELQKVLNELQDAKNQLDKIENDKKDNDGSQNQSQDQESAPTRGFNPMGTYGVKSHDILNDGEDMEYRQAFMDLVLRNKPIPAELRQNQNTTTSDVISVIPTNLVQKIIERMEESGMILPLVTRTSYKGGVTIPTSNVKPVATWTGEGQGSDRQKKVTGSISFTYHKLRCEISMSMEVGTMAISAFEAKFVENVSVAMVQAIEKSILAGDGAKMPKGILKETPKATINLKDAANPTYKELVAIEAEVPVEFETNAKWFMTKKQFMAFASMTDANGQPVARVNYGINGKLERTLLGRDVVLHPYADEMGTHVAGIFNFTDYVLNTIYDMGIQKKQDWETEDLLTKAVMSVDGKAVDAGSLILVDGPLGK